MKEINLGSIQLPLQAATKTFAILAKRGAGKSYTGAVMAEEFYKNGIPFVVFDPIDVWWGLRLAADGESVGLPVVVFGIMDNADIQLDKDAGRKIAQEIVKHNISAVISTFGMPKNQQRKLMTDFAQELLIINNTPRHIFIEEAHEFVPQRVMGDMGAMFNAVSNLVVMGRNRGIGVTLINQRASTINKDVLTQLDTLLAFRNVSPQDRQAMKDWVEYHSAEGDFNEFMKSLPTLPTGEGWIWSPEFMGIFERIKIRERETFHPDREKLGDTFIMPALQQADIQVFIKSFSEKKEENGITEKEYKNTMHPKQAIAKLDREILAEYEEKLRKKDEEIEQLKELRNELQDKLILINKLINTPFGMKIELPQGITQNDNQNIEMWIDKVGRNSGAGRMLRFLVEKSPMKFTRPQLALANRLKYKSGGFRAEIAKLKRNSLILDESGYIQLSPDL